MIKNEYRVWIVIIPLMMLIQVCQADWSRQQGGIFFVRFPDGDFWKTGYGLDCEGGVGTEQFGLVLAGGVSYQNVDKQALLRETSPFLPPGSNPRVSYDFPLRFECGPTIWYAHPVSEVVAVGLEAGVRGVWQFGPTIEYEERRRRMESVDFEIGIIGRLGAQLIFGTGDNRIVAGVLYDTQLNDPRATLDDHDIGDVGYGGLLVNIGYRMLM